ncbi:MAG TPA: N-formylglutamate amidohydrolase, partial [Rhizomicrobium sp.]|nr:N-formylglutamate amidohydrolase [Rhizomicrobium sp.]
AYDIGAAAVTRALAKAYGAPAFLGGWSRLLIDLNRGADDPTIVMKLSDGSIIPGNVLGNRDAEAADAARRINTFHAPYHAAIAAALDRMGPDAVVISMHSFTPAWKGHPRPWEVGVLYDRDTRLAAPLMARLQEAGFAVGDNEPYSGALEGDTLYQHGTLRGLPHVLIEIRQDLIATDDAAQAFAVRLQPILDAALSDMHGTDMHRQG